MSLSTLPATDVAFLMLGVLQTVLALLWALGGWWIAEERRATLHWAAYAAFGALMFPLLVLAMRMRDPAQAEALRAAGNIAGVLAMLALQRGIRAFIGRAADWRGPAVALTLVLIASAIGLDPARGPIRVGVNSGVLTWLCLSMARELHVHARDALHWRRPVLLALPLAFGALGFGARGLRALLEPGSVATEMTTDSALNVGMAFGYLVLTLAFHCVLTVLVVARLVGELRHRSRHDALTGLFNRRALEEALDAQLQRSLRNGEAFALMMIDIDHFKSINDRHGHAAGDKALKQLSSVLRTGVRETDRVARFGGEEFVVLLPDTALVDARPLAERLREQVASQPLVQPNLKLSLTVSIGVAEWRPGSDDATRLMMRADAALYRAKQGGRDRVELAREAPAPVARPASLTS
jgi:diguanylate cyclase (GGDEF)-like protein